MNYFWTKRVGVGRHFVTERDSGIYSYNYNYNYNKNYNYNYYENNNYENYNYNNYNNNDYYYNYNYYYSIHGIIKQYGKVAIHKSGYRSEYAQIDTLFTIKELNATGSSEFLEWIKKFNQSVNEQAKFYKAKTIHYQDLAVAL